MQKCHGLAKYFLLPELQAFFYCCGHSITIFPVTEATDHSRYQINCPPCFHSFISVLQNSAYTCLLKSQLSLLSNLFCIFLLVVVLVNIY